nr:hypothetical transcript [Hymenolepis microstoma]
MGFNSELSYIDDLQKEYECCGGTGPSDWNGKIPESCCANGMPNCSSPYRTQQNNPSRHCGFPSDRTTHSVILIPLGQSSFCQLSPFVHSYSHRMYPKTDLGMTPTLGPMETLQPASRDFSSRKPIPMDCRTRACMLQPPTVSYGNTLDRLKRTYLEPSSKSAPFV